MLVHPSDGCRPTVTLMKNLARLLLCAALLATAFAARAERTYNQAELDALLAPVALYPDGVLSNILVAASYPDDVREAAAWSRGNPQLRGDAALNLVQNLPWHPAVKALVAMPEVLARMDESPQWLSDLGEAYRVHGPYVMETVQSLRQRAQITGNLRSDDQQHVYYEGSNIVVAPAAPHVVYVRYYDPYVVYGPWWWPAFRPVVWRPFVPHVVVVHRPVYVHRPVVVHHYNRPVVVHQNKPPVVRGPVVVRPPVTHAQFRPETPQKRDNGAPSPARQEQIKADRERAKARAQQQGSQQQSHDRGHDRGRDSRPQSRPSSSEPKGLFAAPDRGQDNKGSKGNNNRGRRD